MIDTDGQTFFFRKKENNAKIKKKYSKSITSVMHHRKA